MGEQFSANTGCARPVLQNGQRESVAIHQRVDCAVQLRQGKIDARVDMLTNLSHT